MSKIIWHAITPEAETSFAPRAAELIANGKIVKKNPVRTVIKAEDFFIKCDHRKNHSFNREFAIAKALERAHIPVVEHLACGSDGETNYLITRALPDAVETAALRNAEKIEEGFFTGLCDFLTAFAKSDFIHNDFHCGNILWAAGKFTLVDVHAVRRKLFWEKWRQSPGAFYPLTEFRARLSREDMLKLFIRCGIKEPETFYRQMWCHAASALRKEWSKRRRQLFEAYPKFSCRSGNILHRTDCRCQLDACRGFNSNRAADIFALGLYLELAGIPHAQIAALDSDSSRVFISAADTVAQPAPEAVTTAGKQLKYFGLTLPDRMWNLSPDKLPAINSPEALEHLAAQLPPKEKY